MEIDTGPSLAMDDISDSTSSSEITKQQVNSTANGRRINRTNLRATLVVQSHIRLMRVNIFSFKFICCWVLIQFVWSSFYGERVRACLCHEIYRLHEKSILIILHFTRFFSVALFQRARVSRCLESNVTAKTIKVFSIELQPHWQQPKSGKRYFNLFFFLIHIVVVCLHPSTPGSLYLLLVLWSKRAGRDLI